MIAVAFFRGIHNDYKVTFNTDDSKMRQWHVYSRKHDQNDRGFTLHPSDGTLWAMKHGDLPANFCAIDAPWKASNPFIGTVDY